MLVGVLVSFILARLLKRITFGLELDEIADLLSEVEDLAIEQAALQPVATLVATGVATEEVFAAVAEKVGRLGAADTVQAYRYKPDRSVVRVAAWGPVGGELTAGDQVQTGGRGRVRDDGAGGADAAKGSGLNGLRDRVEAPGGIMAVGSPPRDHRQQRQQRLDPLP